MLTELKYPFNPKTPTVTLQLFLDATAAKPTVAETTSIGFPFELSQIELNTGPGGATTYHLFLFAARNPFIAGDPFGDINLVNITGDTLNGDPRCLPYICTDELILRPRIRLNLAGLRLRLVHNDPTFVTGVRALFTLTPLA